MVPRGLRRAVQAAAEALPPGKQNMSFDFRLKRALRGVAFPPALWNPVWLGAIDPRDLGACFEDPLPLDALFEEAITLWNNCRNDNDVDRTLEFYTNLYLPEMILAKADRAGMHASLESRAPFLDLALVEFCRRLPHGYKFRNGRRKVVLKEALRGVAPDFVLNRRKKGFGIPLVSWLGRLGPPKRATWPPGIKPGYIRSRWAAFGERHSDERLLLWADLCLSYLPVRA
jgi:asparagine synthase (glutamine-hydrolysing)